MLYLKPYFKILIMRYIICLLSITFLSTFSFGQKDLSLSESVMGQYRQFRPEHIVGFQWIPNTEKYSYFKKYTNLVIGEVGGKDSTALSIGDVNDAVDGAKFSYFAGLKWMDEENFVIASDTTIIQFNWTTKKGEIIYLPSRSEEITFSHDKAKIAFTKDNNLYTTSFESKKTVSITDFSDKNIVSGQAIARSEFGITGGLFWSPTSEKLAFYQKDETAVHDYPLLNNDDYPGSLELIKYPMAGQPSEKAKVGIYSFATQKTVYLKAQHGEENYLTNLSWSPDEQFVLVAEVARSQDHIWLQKYTAEGKFVKTLFEETSETWVEPERPAYFPNTHATDFVWVSERDGFDNLYLYSIEGELKKQLTSNNFVLKEIIAAHDGLVYFTATGENPLNTLLYQVNTRGKQKLLTKEEGTHSVDVHCSEEFIFDSYSSHDIPNKVVIRNAKGKIVTELVDADNPLKDYKLTPAEIKTIEAEDGTKLYTRLIKPKDFDATKKYPVLIYVYGGPHAQLITNSWGDGASLWMQWMANQGYIVFTLDNRGSGNRGVEFEHGIHRQLGTLEHQDQLKGVEYLSSLQYIDTSRIAIHGWSFGGFMTNTMMLRSPEIFKVGVAGGPVTDWKYYEVMYGERYMDRPQENKEGYKKASIIEHAENLKGDLLLIHGTIDPVVVMQQDLSLIEKFVDLGIQVDFFPYPMHEHNVRGKDRVHLMEKVLTYIIDHNK